MSSKLYGIIALTLTAIVVAACAPATDQSQVATLQAQLAAAQSGGQSAGQVATLQAQLAAAQAAGQPEQPSFNPTFKNPDTFTVMDIGDPETLDPATGYETTGQNIMTSLYDTLVFYKGGSVDEFVPMLAEKWDVSADGKTYTFTIRKGVKFHDGTEMTVDDVAYTFQRDLLTGWDGNNGGPESLLLQPIVGYSTQDDLVAANGGDEAKACEAVKAAVVADASANTVTFNLPAPATYFLQLVAANSFGAIQSKAFVQANGGWDGDCKTWKKFLAADATHEKDPLFNRENGTGAFKLDHWTPGDELVMTRNDDWWVKAPLWEGSPVDGPAKLKTVVLKNVTEFSTRLAALQAGDADYATILAADYDQVDPMVKEYVEGSDLNADKSNMTIKNPNGSLRVYHGIAQGNSVDVFLNQHIVTTGGNPMVGVGDDGKPLADGQFAAGGIPPDFFSDIHVRKAFNYCFDRDTFIKDAIAGEAIAHRGPIPEGLPGFDANSTIYEYSIDKCKAELDQAWGGKLKDSGFTITFAYNSGNNNRRIAMGLLQDGLVAAYGGSQGKLTINIVSMAWPTYLATRREGRLPLYVSGWLEDFHDSWDWVHPYMSCSGDFSNKQFLPPEQCKAWDDLMATAVTSTDAAKAKDIYTQLQKEAMDNAIDLFIYQPQARWYSQLWVNGYYFRPLYDLYMPYWAGISKVQPQ